MESAGQISVIIAAYNASATITACLSALARAHRHVAAVCFMLA